MDYLARGEFTFIRGKEEDGPHQIVGNLGTDNDSVIAQAIRGQLPS